MITWKNELIEAGLSKIEAYTYMHPFYILLILMVIITIIACLLITTLLGIIGKLDMDDTIELSIEILPIALCISFIAGILTLSYIYSQASAKVDEAFNAKSYTETVNITYIYSFGLSSEISGEVNGNCGHVYGQIVQDDIFRLVSKTEEGSTYFDKISYAKGNTKIWENDTETPRIEEHIFSKEAFNKNDSYVEYVIYIPVDTITIG